MLDIRPATAADWPQIWPFFSAIVAEGETYTFPIGSSDQGRALWLAAPPARTVVAVDAGTVLGTATMGPNRPANGAHIGTASFMVSPAARGRGVGRALAEHAVAWHRDSGFRGIQFNAVVETNLAAIRLWRALGFVIVGTVPGAFCSPTQGYVGLHVMFLDLTSAASPAVTPSIP